MDSCFRAISPMSVTDLHDLVGSIISITSDLSKWEVCSDRLKQKHLYDEMVTASHPSL